MNIRTAQSLFIFRKVHINIYWAKNIFSLLFIDYFSSAVIVWDVSIGYLRWHDTASLTIIQAPCGQWEARCAGIWSIRGRAVDIWRSVHRTPDYAAIITLRHQEYWSVQIKLVMYDLMISISKLWVGGMVTRDTWVLRVEYRNILRSWGDLFILFYEKLGHKVMNYCIKLSQGRCVPYLPYIAFQTNIT